MAEKTTVKPCFQSAVLFYFYFYSRRRKEDEKSYRPNLLFMSMHVLVIHFRLVD